MFEFTQGRVRIFLNLFVVILAVIEINEIAKMESGKGSDEVGNGFNNIEEIEDTFQDAEDGQCLGLSKNGKADERDARGRPG